jgi:hypothetical protein
MQCVHLQLYGGGAICAVATMVDGDVVFGVSTLVAGSGAVCAVAAVSGWWCDMRSCVYGLNGRAMSRVAAIAGL